MKKGLLGWSLTVFMVFTSIVSAGAQVTNPETAPEPKTEGKPEAKPVDEFGRYKKSIGNEHLFSGRIHL